MHQHPGATFMLPGATVPGNITSRTSSHAFTADFWSERYIKQIKYIFCAASVDFASVDVSRFVTKRFKKSFSFVFYIL